MTGPAKHVAMDTDVRLTVRAESISRASGGGWQINADEGREYRATAVIVTAPLPQTLALLEAGEVALDAGIRNALLGADYDPCLAILVRLHEEVALGEPGVVESSSEVIDWIADNHVKGVSAAGPALTVHCRPRFSREFYDKPDEQIIETVAEALPPRLAAPRREASVKRWRYARPKVNRGSALPQESGLPGLFFAGDAFHSPRVEGAAVSGFAAADSAMRYLQKT